MISLDYDGAIDYLLDLALRHKAIRASRAGLSDPDPQGDSLYPLVFVEEDPLAEEENPSADKYTLAFQILDRAPDSSVTNRQLLQRTKHLGDELIAQIRNEHVVALVSKPSKLALVGVAGDSLASGWRYEIQIQVLSTLDRNAISARFAPYVPPAS